MGVDRTTYLFFGVKLDLKELENKLSNGEKYFSLYDIMEDEIDGSPDATFDAVYDGMMGKYLIVGKRLGSVDEYGEGDDLIKISLQKFTNLAASVNVEAINEKLELDLKPEDFQILFFNHFS